MFPPETIISNFFETFDKSSVTLFREFLNHNKDVSRWIISCDFCLHDRSRPNDCICFSITPYNNTFENIKTSITSVLGRDIKNTRSVSDSAANLLRDKRFFHIAFLLQKNRAVFNNGPNSDPLEISREVANITLLKSVEMERGEPRISLLRKLVQESKAKSFNHGLFADLYLLALFLPIISLLIARERKAEMIGWFSDRDSMTEWCDRILWEFATENVHGLAERLCIDISGTEFPIAVPDPKTDEMWFDHLVRLSDYIAGTLAVWDLESNHVPTTPKSDKFLKMVESVISDSENMVLLGLDIGENGLQWKRILVQRTEDDQNEI